MRPDTPVGDPGDGSALRLAFGRPVESDQRLRTVRAEFERLRMLGAERPAEHRQQFVVGGKGLLVAALCVHRERGDADRASATARASASATA
ncbi:hypothetical protein [Streptomyces sp. NPDC002078]